MIQTSTEPESFAGVADALVLLLLLLSSLPHAASVRPAAHSTASNTFGVLTLPPRTRRLMAARHLTEAVPDTTTFLITWSPALAAAPSPADSDHRDRSTGRTPPPPLGRSCWSARRGTQGRARGRVAPPPPPRW